MIIFRTNDAPQARMRNRTGADLRRGQWAGVAFNARQTLVDRIVPKASRKALPGVIVMALQPIKNGGVGVVLVCP